MDIEHVAASIIALAPDDTTDSEISALAHAPEYQSIEAFVQEVMDEEDDSFTLADVRILVYSLYMQWRKAENLRELGKLDPNSPIANIQPMGNSEVIKVLKSYGLKYLEVGQSKLEPKPAPIPTSKDIKYRGYVKSPPPPPSPRKHMKLESITPSQLSDALYRIASEIDNSERPSISMIVASLKDILYKIANFKSVVNNVAYTFNQAEIEPPLLRQVGNNTYKGKFKENGWELTIVEDSPGNLYITLDGIPVSDLKEVIKFHKEGNKPEANMSFSAKKVYDIDDKDVEREFSIQVWDRPDGTHYVMAILTKGSPIEDRNQLRDIFNANWSGGNDFLKNLLMASGHPAFVQSS